MPRGPSRLDGFAPNSLPYRKHPESRPSKEQVLFKQPVCHPNQPTRARRPQPLVIKAEGENPRRFARQGD